MALGEARSGGDYVDYEPLANEGAAVLVKIHEFLPQKHMPENDSYVDPVRMDVLILTGDQAGRVVRNDQPIKRGITQALRANAIGGEYVFSVSWKQPESRSRKAYIIFTPVPSSDDRYKYAESLFAQYGNDPYSAFERAAAPSPLAQAAAPAPEPAAAPVAPAPAPVAPAPAPAPAAIPAQAAAPAAAPAPAPAPFAPAPAPEAVPASPAAAPAAVPAAAPAAPAPAGQVAPVAPWQTAQAAGVA